METMRRVIKMAGFLAFIFGGLGIGSGLWAQYSNEDGSGDLWTGTGSSTSGNWSTATGEYSTATGTSSSAYGQAATASGLSSVTIGNLSNANK